MGKAFNLLMFGFVVWQYFAAKSKCKASIFAADSHLYLPSRFSKITFNNNLLFDNYLVKIRPSKIELSGGC